MHFESNLFEAIVLETKNNIAMRKLYLYINQALLIKQKIGKTVIFKNHVIKSIVFKCYYLFNNLIKNESENGLESFELLNVEKYFLILIQYDFDETTSYLKMKYR